MSLETLFMGTNQSLVDLAELIGRVAIGVCFIIHALGKLGVVGQGNMAGFVAWLDELGVPMPRIQARMAMLSELSGGTLLVLGLFARPACLLLIFTMIIARPDWSSRARGI